MTWGQSYAADQTSLARSIAYVAHRAQVRAGSPPEPYFLHVKRVALRFRPGPERCVAYLHDVVEDTAVDFTDLAILDVDSNVVDAVRLLTHEHGIGHDGYLAYIWRILNESARTDAGRWARAVKRADLCDNLGAVDRLLAGGQPRLAARLAVRYRAALSILDE